MSDIDDWADTTWEGNRQRQHERFRALSFRDKVRVIEQMSEVASLLREKWRARMNRSGPAAAEGDDSQSS